MKNTDSKQSAVEGRKKLPTTNKPCSSPKSSKFLSLKLPMRNVFVFCPLYISNFLINGFSGSLDLVVRHANEHNDQVQIGIRAD